MFVNKKDKDKDKDFTNSLNELLELIEHIATDIDENEYLKACNHLKKLHDYKNNEKYSFEISLCFFIILWILSIIIVFSFLLLAPNVSYIAGT